METKEEEAFAHPQENKKTQEGAKVPDLKQVRLRARKGPLADRLPATHSATTGHASRRGSGEIREVAKGAGPGKRERMAIVVMEKAVRLRISGFLVCSRLFYCAPNRFSARAGKYCDLAMVF